MNDNHKDVLYKIEEFSLQTLILRVITAILAVSLILKFKDDRIFISAVITMLACIQLFLIEKQTLIATTTGLEIKEFNVLNLFTKRRLVLYQDIADIQFTPSTFSFTVFVLNLLAISKVDSNSKSIITLQLKNGNDIKVKNAGDAGDVANLNRIASTYKKVI